MGDTGLGNSSNSTWREVEGNFEPEDFLRSFRSASRDTITDSPSKSWRANLIGCI
jgi:hypothetical protein